MFDNAAVADRHPPNFRSKLSNDATLAPGVDRRTRGGRRYFDIVESLSKEFPGAEPVALRELASLRFTQEMEQGAIIRGEQASPESLIRLSHAIERKERAMRASSRKRLATPTPLGEFLRARQGGGSQKALRQVAADESQGRPLAAKAQAMGVRHADHGDAGPGPFEGPQGGPPEAAP